MRRTLELLLLSLVSRISLQTLTDVSYSIIGVSGTLQDGFPLRHRLDYSSSADGNETVPAIWIGKGLVRGYKAYLDIKDAGWREYAATEPPQVPNAVVLPTGCFQHANLYWIYAVDSRQMLNILHGEPRFLGISPDTGLIDLTAAETDNVVKRFARHEIVHNKLGDGQGGDADVVSIPLVTGVWFHTSFVESPIVKTNADGTEITSFDESIALWAGVNRNDLVMSTHVAGGDDAAASRHEAAWETLYRTIRAVEHHHTTNNSRSSSSAPTYCPEQVRLGASPFHARLNYAMSWDEIQRALSQDEPTCHS